jgi:hypothetical protein
MASPILVHEVRLTLGGRERRRRRLLQRAIRWALWLFAFSAFILVASCGGSCFRYVVRSVVRGSAGLDEGALCV